MTDSRPSKQSGDYLGKDREELRDLLYERDAELDRQRQEIERIRARIQTWEIGELASIGKCWHGVSFDQHCVNCRKNCAKCIADESSNLEPDPREDPCHPDYVGPLELKATRVICPSCEGDPVGTDGSICSRCDGACMVDASAHEPSAVTRLVQEVAAISCEQSVSNCIEAAKAILAGAAPETEVAPPRCLCGRGKYYHPWRFCSEYKPAIETSEQRS